MKSIKILFAAAYMLLINFTMNAQTGIELNDESYKFKITFPSGWEQRKVEETDTKDAISYSFDMKSGKMAAMLLSFKVDEVKNLTDMIYTLEKDLTLNIPKREGDYRNFDSGNFDGIAAKYKDNEFVELIYYYRTKLTDAQNYTYVLRFIIPQTYFNASVEADLSKIAESFTPVSE